MTEPKPDDAAPPEPGDKPKPSLLNDKDAPAGAPAAYAEFKAPEGYELDKDTVDKAVPIFKDLNLSQEGAQKLIDFYSDLSRQAAEAPMRLWQETQEGWIKEIKADKDIGHKLPAVKSTISKAIDGLGDPTLAKSFREAMDLTGAGNHPAFVKAFFKLAQQLTEGGHVVAGKPAATSRPDGRPLSPAAALYPNLTSSS